MQLFCLKSNSFENHIIYFKIIILVTIDGAVLYMVMAVIEHLNQPIQSQITFSFQESPKYSFLLFIFPHFHDSSFHVLKTTFFIL